MLTADLCDLTTFCVQLADTLDLAATFGYTLC